MAEEIRRKRMNMAKVAVTLLVVKSIITTSILIVGFSAMFKIPTFLNQLSAQQTGGSPSVLILMFTGFAIGCYGTLVGIGGGPLVVPVLYFFYGWDSEFLVATALFIVFLNALSGSIGYSRQKRIDYKSGVMFSMAAIPGAVLTSFIHHIFDVSFFNRIFGCFLIFLAIYSFLSVKKIKEIQKVPKDITKSNKYRHVKFVDHFNTKFSYYSNDNLGICMNALMGFLVGFLGIGGGVLQVPILAFLLRYPIHIATATSHFITMTVCFFALIPQLFLGNIFFKEALWLGVAVVIGAQVGALFAPRVKSKFIIYLFVLILLVFAVKMLG